MNLLKDGGVAGFILPNKFLNAEYGRGLRRLLSEKKAIFRLLDFRDYQVFDGVTTYTCLLFLRKARSSRMTYGRLRDQHDPSTTRLLRDEDFNRFDVKMPSEWDVPWNFIPEEDEPLFRRLEKIPQKLGDVAEAVFQGLKTGKDKVYIVHVLREESGISVVVNGLGHQEHRIEPQLLRPLLKGREARRWGVNWGKRYVVTPYEEVEGNLRLISMADLQQRFPAAHEYFLRHSVQLKARDRGALGRDPEWHRFSRLQNMERFHRPKLLVQEEADHNRFSLDTRGFHFVRCYGIALKTKLEEDYYYTLGVLNSRPVEFYHHLISTPYEGGFFDYRSQFVTPLPLPEGDPKIRREIAAVARAATAKYASLSEHSEGTDGRSEVLRDILEIEKELDRLAISLFEITGQELARLPPVRSRQGDSEHVGDDSREEEGEEDLAG